MRASHFIHCVLSLSSVVMIHPLTRVILTKQYSHPLTQAVLTKQYSHPLTQVVLTKQYSYPLTQVVLTGSQQPRKISPEALKKYVGRYELEVGIIPISTLDVTIENNELWLKPSVVKKRRLLHKTQTVFSDEIEGTPLTFNKDVDGKIVSVTFVYEGEQYTAQRVDLPPPSLKGNTTFRLAGFKDARVVALAGSFNSWNQSQFIFGKEADGWVCRIDLEPGKHAYKFIVDGNWLLDPANSNTEDDDYGLKNSVIVVPKPVLPPAPTATRSLP